MAYKGLHNPPGRNPDGSDNMEDDVRPDVPGGGWRGGREDFETIWTLKGHKLPPTDLEDTAEIGKISRNHNRLHDTPGFC